MTTTTLDTVESTDRAGAESQTVERFSVWARTQHAAIIILFAVLLITGLPQKWPFFETSQWLIDAMGGIFVTRWIHRITGVVFTLLTVVHLQRLFNKGARKLVKAGCRRGCFAFRAFAV